MVNVLAHICSFSETSQDVSEHETSFGGDSAKEMSRVIPTSPFGVCGCVHA